MAHPYCRCRPVLLVVRLAVHGLPTQEESKLRICSCAEASSVSVTSKLEVRNVYEI